MFTLNRVIGAARVPSVVSPLDPNARGPKILLLKRWAEKRQPGPLGDGPEGSPASLRYQFAPAATRQRHLAGGSRSPGRREPDLYEQAGEGGELSGAGDHRQARDGAGGRAGRAAE